MPLTTYTTGEVLTAASLNANFAFAAAGLEIAIFNETQASGTSGGTFTSGSYVKRVLNTTVVNTITGCSIASSVITLPAGTYSVTATAPGLGVDGHKAKLRNTTASTDIQIGTNERTLAASSVITHSTVLASFTLSVSSTIELQHRCQTTKASDGFGLALSFSDSEIYSQIIIEKTA